MALDPNIALGFRPIQLEQRNPLAEYAQIQNIQTGQLQNQLARQQMEQEQGVINYLGSANLNTPEGISGLNKFGKTGLGYAKLIAEQEANALKNKEMQGKLREQQMSALGTGLTSVMNDPTDEKLAQAFDRLDATGVDTKKLRDQFGKLTDLESRKAGINSYVMSHPEGRAALAFVQPKPEKADLYGQTVWLDTNPNSPTYLQPVKSLADQPLPPAVVAQKKDIANAGAARQVTHVNTQIPASEEAQKEFMKESRVSYNTLKNVPSVLSNMEEAKKLIPSAKSFMGPGGEPMLKAASFLNNRLGTSINVQGVTDASELRSRLFNGVLENLRKLDAQPTAGQQQVLQDAIGNLGTDPTALPRVLDAFGGILKEKVGAYNAEVTDAESRGVKFPYRPQIKLSNADKPAAAAGQIPGQTPAAPVARTVTRTGTMGNRRVIQYSDGSVEYAN
jgi:hypothetical protein